MGKRSQGKKDIRVLVTAGTTREPIDAVRHISNFATGELGVEIVKEAHDRGYDVTLLYGFGTAEIPDYIKTVRFTTAQSLLEKVLEKIGNTDIYISSAAVVDYAPIPVNEKISSERDELTIKLRPTPKVLKEAKAAAKPGTEFVAFKLNYNVPEEELIRQAMKSYGEIADIIIANDLTKIEGQSHEAILLYKGDVVNRMYSKNEIANAILDCLEKRALET